jgi:hypothetical protein
MIVLSVPSSPRVRNPVALTPSGPGALLAARGVNELVFLSPSTGADLRTVSIGPKYVFTGGSPNTPPQLVVTSDGRTAFVSVQQAGKADPTPVEILAVPLHGGTVQIVATNASEPAISPDGRELAYVMTTIGPGIGYRDPSSTIVILNLTSGHKKVIALCCSENAPGTSALTDISYLSWAPDGGSLVFSGSASGDLIGTWDWVGLLDLSKPVVELPATGANPRTLAAPPSPEGGWEALPGPSDGDYVTSTSIAVIQTDVNTDCGDQYDPSCVVHLRILKVDPNSYKSVTIFSAPSSKPHEWFSIEQIAFKPDGTLFLLAETDIANQPAHEGGTLYRVDDGRAVKLSSPSDLALAWAAHEGSVR